MDLIKKEPLLRKKRSHRKKDLYFEGKILFCTYKNCSINPKEVIKFFISKKIEYCVVGREYQALSKTYDLLVYVHFSSCIITSNQMEFDYIDDFGKTYHPFFNIKLPKRDMLLFITKKGHYYQYNINVKKYFETIKSKASYFLYNLLEAKIGEIELVTVQKDTQINIVDDKTKVKRNKKENKPKLISKKEKNSKEIIPEIKSEVFTDITVKMEERLK